MTSRTNSFWRYDFKKEGSTIRYTIVLEKKMGRITFSTKGREPLTFSTNTLASKTNTRIVEKTSITWIFTKIVAWDFRKKKIYFEFEKKKY